MFRDIYGCHSWGEVLLASSGWKSGMLLNILQYTGSPLTSPMRKWPAETLVVRRLKPLFSQSHWFRSTFLRWPCGWPYCVVSIVLTAQVSEIRQETKILHRRRPTVIHKWCDYIPADSKLTEKLLEATREISKGVDSSFKYLRPTVFLYAKNSPLENVMENVKKVQNIWV